MKKHRYVFAHCPPQNLAAVCQQFEDQGYEVLHAGMSVMPAGGPIPSQSAVMLSGCISARIERSAPKTEMERESEARSESRIVTLDGGNTVAFPQKG